MRPRTRFAGAATRPDATQARLNQARLTAGRAKGARPRGGGSPGRLSLRTAANKTCMGEDKDSLPWLHWHDCSLESGRAAVPRPVAPRRP